MKKTLMVSTLAALVFASLTANALGPNDFPFKGLLLDKDNKVVSRMANVQFSIYGSTEKDSPPLWQEIHSLDVKAGTVDIFLGRNTPINKLALRGNARLYLGIRIDAQPEQERFPIYVP